MRVKSRNLLGARNRGPANNFPLKQYIVGHRTYCLLMFVSVNLIERVWAAFRPGGITTDFVLAPLRASIRREARALRGTV